MIKSGSVFISCLLTILASGCAITPPDYGYKQPYRFGPRPERVKEYEAGTFRKEYDEAVKKKQMDEAKLERK